ncbi:MAG TPA: cupin domain-containing protein [Balneolaceae bacterium]|nr:cupin domain-containing protein [Balneolaceae bacterium]
MATTQEKPTLNFLKTGNEFKTFAVTGKAGMEMPKHISTKEAVVVVRKGNATLKIGEKEHKLATGDVFIIPGRKVHSLSLHSDFKALVIMALESEILFK